MASTSIVSGRRHRLRKISCLTAATALGFSLSVTAGPASATEDGCSSKTTHGEQVKSKSEAKQGSAQSCGSSGANQGEAPADKTDVGEGQLSVDSSELKKDGTVTLKGEGFAEFKSEGKFAVKFEGVEDGATQTKTAGTESTGTDLPEGQPCGKVDSSGDLDVTDQNFLPKADGSFELKVKVPEITVKGEYWVRVVGTTSTGVSVEKWASFKATSTTTSSSSSSSADSSNATDDSATPKPSATSATPSDQPVTPIGPSAEPSASATASPSASPSADPSASKGESKTDSSKLDVKVTRVKTDSKGVITAKVTGSGFTSKSELTAILSEQNVSWSVEGKTVESIKVNADGTFSGTIKIDAGLALAGKQTLKLTDSAGREYSAEFSASAAFSFSAESTVGSTSTVKVVNVPEGAVITSIGTASSVWHSESVTVSGSSTVEIPNVTIPEDAKVGERIVVTYKINGEEFACETGAVVEKKDGSSDSDKGSDSDKSADASKDSNATDDSKGGNDSDGSKDSDASKAGDSNGGNATDDSKGGSSDSDKSADASKDSNATDDSKGGNDSNQGSNDQPTGDPSAQSTEGQSGDSGSTEGNFDVKSGELPKGLYQSAYNAQSNFLFVTTVSGKAPSTQTKLLKVDASTLKVVESVTPESDGEGGLYGVYGIALDNSNGYIWTTNTQQGTVAVYDQETLKLVKQFKASEQTTSQASSVVVDEQTHMAYVSSANSNYIDVYSGADGTPTYVTRIQVGTASQSFEGVQNLSLDPATGMLYTVSLKSQVAVSINVRSSYEINYFQLGDNVKSASGVAFDSTRNYLYIASRQSNNLVVVNTQTGEVVANIPTGDQALSVSYDSTTGLVYVVNRRGGNVTVVNSVTLQVVGNVTVGTNPNHVTTANGQVFVVNRDNPNLIFRITSEDVQASQNDSGQGTDNGSANGSNDSNGSNGANGSDSGNANASGNESNGSNGSDNSNGSANGSNGSNGSDSANTNASGNESNGSSGSDSGNANGANDNRETATPNANDNGGNAGGSDNGNANGNNGGNAGGNNDNQQAATPNANDNGGNAGGSDNGNANGNNGGNAGGSDNGNANGNNGGNAGGSDNGNANGNGNQEAAAPNGNDNGNNGGNAGGSDNGNNGGNAGGSDNGNANGNGNREAAAPNGNDNGNNGGNAGGSDNANGNGNSSNTARNNSGLANTGTNVTIIGLVALGLIALGGAALRFRSRNAE